MSSTPIFDQLMEEFMTEKRWTPLLAISEDYYAYDVPAGTPSDTVELLEPPIAETRIELDQTVETAAEWIDKMDREINEAMNHLKPVVMFNATAADALSQFGGAPFQVVTQEEVDSWCIDYTKVEADGTPIPHPSFVDMMNQHRQAILHPETMPTRGALGLLTAGEMEDWPEEPAEEQHVFPITREGGRVKLLQEPATAIVNRVRAGLHGLLYDEVKA